MSMRSTFWVVLVSGAMTTTAWAIPLRTEDAKLTPSDGGRPQAVALHGNLIAVGVPVSGARGAVYVFENVGGIWTEQIKLVETSVFLFDNYGAAVALENDLLVVGAPFYEPTSSGAGSAFVYRNGPGGWALEQQLISSGSMLDDQFGKSVSISGDRIAVSANQENLGEGAVYVFLYDGLNWVEEARITSSDLSVGDSFGRSVSLDGGLLGVGASNDDDACPLDPACGSGSAYVFRREGINWIEEAKLTASDAAERDLFGTSISLSSGSIVVGAGGNDDAGTNSGSAYVFRRYGTKWVQEAKLVASDAESLDTFGFSVFLDGDSAISGACCKDGIASDTGSAYLYQRFGTTWFEAVILVASDPSQGAGLGNHVAIDGNTAVAAASSAVYVYSLTGVPPVIPASSSLGLLIGALLLLGFGGVMIRRRSQRRLSEHSPVQGTWDTNLLVAAAICSFSSSLLAQIPDFSVAHHPQQLLVRFKPSATVQARQDFHSKVGSQELKAYTLVPGLVLVDVQGGDLQAACGEYAGNSNVLYAEPNYGLAQAGDCDVCVATDPNCPNDPEFDKLWGLHNTGQTLYPPWPEPDDEDSGICDADIDALEAWAIWTGDSDFRIAVLDTGVDYNHPDLQPNMSATLGYDFIWDDADPSPEPEDSYHGTHVAGTIGAVGDNGAGVVGVNWDCEIVALKVLGDGNLVSAAVDALEYVVDNNIKVSNNSWGVPYFSNALLDAIYASQAIGHILVVAAHNFGQDIDVYPMYPAAYDLNNIISVAATDNDDNLADFPGPGGSNFGAVSVDLGAPGLNVLSTEDNNGYKYRWGTSMATPHVTGVVALLWSYYPNMDWRAVRLKVLSTVRQVPALDGITATGGVVNALAVLDCNNTGIDDDCDIDCGPSGGVCDVTGCGLSNDCTGNLIPDECEYDCNGNSIADSCDIDAGTSADCNGNDILDECESCWRAYAPTAEPNPISKNRYISFRSGNPGRNVALRVTGGVGKQAWVGQPLETCENGGQTSPPCSSPAESFWASRLVCDPVYLDWRVYGTIHVYDDEIVPGDGRSAKAYAVQAIDCRCDSEVETDFSDALIVWTPKHWADVAAPFDVGNQEWPLPDGIVDTNDVTAVQDKFLNLPAAPVKARADVDPATPNRRVNILDVLRVSSAVGGGSYPFSDGAWCPPPGTE